MKRITILTISTLLLLGSLSACTQSIETALPKPEKTQVDIVEIPTEHMPAQSTNDSESEKTMENDWSVEMISTTCDGVNARVLFRVTAPTDINLEEANKDYSYDDVVDCIIPGNTSGMTMEGRRMFETSMGLYSTEHNVLWSQGAGWEKDNDGLANTLNWFVSIRLDKLDPNQPQTLNNPFGTTTFYILFENFKHAWYDVEAQKAIEEKYAGQDYIIDDNEMDGLYKTEILVEQEWKFTVNFHEQDGADM